MTSYLGEPFRRPTTEVPPTRTPGMAGRLAGILVLAACAVLEPDPLLQPMAIRRSTWRPSTGWSAAG